jgi:NAD(P)H-dependent FMN reductase
MHELGRAHLGRRQGGIVMEQANVATGGSAESESSLPNLHVVIASTRPGRVGPPVGRWIHDLAARQGTFRVELVDLAEVGLPLLDEPKHPRLGQYTQPHTKAWSATVDAADAFVFVMPEYNHGFNAPLKNAIDFLHREWAHKPVGFVSYGGVAAGTRAVQMLKPVLTVLGMVPVTAAVPIPFVKQVLSEDGTVTATDAMETAAKGMLDELLRWTVALREMRRGT